MNFYTHSLTVRVVLSKRAGMGKTLYAKRCSEKFRKISKLKTSLVIVPVQGPVVSHEKIISLLEADQEDFENRIYLLDVDPTVS